MHRDTGEVTLIGTSRCTSTCEQPHARHPLLELRAGRRNAASWLTHCSYHRARGYADAGRGVAADRGTLPGGITMPALPAGCGSPVSLVCFIAAGPSVSRFPRLACRLPVAQHATAAGAAQAERNKDRERARITLPSARRPEDAQRGSRGRVKTACPPRSPRTLRAWREPPFFLVSFVKRTVRYFINWYFGDFRTVWDRKEKPAFLFFWFFARRELVWKV
jgi:hypothetical protein